MNLLLDTNAIIDFLGRKPPFFADAAEIIAAGYFGDVTLWAPTQSFKDAFYVLENYIDSDRVQDAMLSLAQVVNPVDLTSDDVITAAKLKWRDYEDCLVALCANKIRADYLITRDCEGFRNSLVPTLSPAGWLAEMRKQGRLTFDAVNLTEECNE